MIFKGQQTYNNIHHILGNKTIFKECKRIEIILGGSDHIGIKLEINNINFKRKFPNIWKLESTLLSTSWVKKKLKKKKVSTEKKQKNPKTLNQIMVVGFVTIVFSLLATHLLLQTMQCICQNSTHCYLNLVGTLLQKKLPAFIPTATMLPRLPLFPTSLGMIQLHGLDRITRDI